MNKLLFALILICSLAVADDGLYLSNLPGYATGSTLSSKNGLDVNIISPISVLNPADGLTGSPVPTYASYSGGNKAGNLTGLLIGQQTMANSLACVISSDQSSIPVTASNASVGLTGAAVPASASLAGFKDGSGNLQAAKVNGSAALTVDGSGVTQPVSGTVTANIGTTNGLALDATVSALQVSQGSTTAGEKGDLVLGAVTTAAPSYATAQSSPLSLTLSGALRVDASASTQPISGTVTSNQGTSPWVDNVSQFGGSNVVTGIGASGAGIPRVTVSNDSTVGLVAGSAIIGKVSIDQTTPGTTNGVQINAALPAGGNTIGAVTQASGPWTQNQTQVGGVSVTLGSKTSANSYPVVIASDQAAVQTLNPKNANGTLSQSLVVGNGAAVSFSAPANAVGFIAEASSDNTQNLRCSSGTTATTTLGLRLEPGRDTGFIPGSASVTCIAEAGSNQEVDIQWVSQ